MDKKTGTIITIVAAVLTLCCSITCCVGGILNMVDGGNTLGLDINPYLIGLPAVCLGILGWAIPILLWVFLVRGREDEAKGAALADV